MIKVLINATNARNVGGGLQVVVNFILATLKIPRCDIEWFYAVSKCLDEVYLPESFKENVAGRYYVFPNQPDFRHTYRKVQKQLYILEAENEIDVVFTPLGPSYHFFKSREVIRFVNAWVISANKYSWSTLRWKAKMKMRLHNVLLRYLIKQKRFIITQTNIIKKDLIDKLDFNPNNIKVLCNVLPAIYSSISREHMKSDKSWVDITAIGGGEHKNLDIIPDIINLLKIKYGITNFRFHITLPNSSPVLPVINHKVEEFQCPDCIVNHGNLKQTELADLYRNSDICFLPSVLEVFSASTIEAMFFKLPTVATKLPFNTEVFNDSCLYYEPMNVAQAAEKLIHLAEDYALRQELVTRMDHQLKQFSNFENYFNDTVDFLAKVGRGELD